MKMKKTIATVMAAMTAVSAMAATVSADQEEINLHYDLRTKVTTIEKGRGTVTQQYTAVTGTAGSQELYVAYPTLQWANGDTLGGRSVPQLEFGALSNGLNRKVKEAIFTFNLTNQNESTQKLPALTQTIKFTTDVEKVTADPTWIYVNEDTGCIDTNGDGIADFRVFSDATDSGGDGQVNIPVSFTNITQAAQYWTNPIAGYLNLGTFDLQKYGYVEDDHYYSVKNDALDGSFVANDIINALGMDFGFNSVTASITYETEGFYDAELINGWAAWSWGDLHNVGYKTYYTGEELAWLGIPYAQETAVNSQYLSSGLVSVTDAMTQAGRKISGIQGVAVTKAGEKKEHIYPLLSTSSVYNYYSTTKGYVYVNGELKPVYDRVDKSRISGTETITYVDDNGNTQTIEVPVVENYTDVITGSAGTNGNKLLTTNDVIAAIRRSGSGTSPLSVINDAIANDYDVEFTFTSATGYVGTKYTNAVLQWVNFGEELPYPVINAWNKATFGQHLYSSAYTNVSSPYSGASFDPAYSLSANAATDMYGSFSSAWAQNLVTAGLVVNSELTMQLNDVQKLQWDANQLTFHWDDVIDGKVTRVNQVLTTMLLYTPVDWYWDSLDVKVIKTEDVEEVNPGESLEEEGEELEEEVVEEEEVWEEEEEPEIEEEPEEEEPEIEEVPEVEEAPAEVVAPVAESPKTGNAPVALAVIPVALAAAAVIAKKRG